MKKMLSRITAAVLATGMLATEAGAVLTVPDSTDAGTIAGSGMWLVQLYNEGDPDGDKPATDYGIDYSAVAGARFTIELDLDNPDLEEDAFSLFEGNIGGGIVLSCCGDDIIQYEDDGETVTEIYSTYNWPTHNWWGIEYVNSEGETVDTNPNTMDDDLTNDNELSTVKTGDYTYTITADFVNPLSCETDEWEINEIAVMQLAFQEWGSDTIPVEITCCEILDADGEVLVWFDGQGNPSLENIAEQPSTDEPSGDREVITLSGTATTIEGEWGPDCTLTQISTPAVDGAYVLAPTDKVEVEVVCTDESTDTSAWTLAVTGFDSEWSGWIGVNGESGELSFSTTVQAVMDAISVEDIDQLGGLLLQVWNTTIGDEVNWTATITPDDGSTDPETPSDPEEPAGDYNGYIFLQTEAFSFRNKWYEESYGRDTEYFDDVVVWSEDSEAFPEYSDYYDAELKAYVMPANFMDTTISGDGFYRVGVTDFDWALDGSDLFNMLGVATDIPYSEDVIITDISLRIDGEEVETYENGYVDLEDQENGYLVVTLANIWDTTFDGYDGVYPTESVEISFNVSGLGSSAVDPDEPTDPDEPEDPDGPEASVNNGYIFLQTEAFSFRNKWYDESYGEDSVYFYDVLVWGDDAETYPDYAEYYNSDISAYVMPASFTDAIISGDGSYQVSITDFDWAMDGADSFNLLGISTDIPYSDDITISDITILVDDMIVQTDAEACISDDEGYICITLVDIWDDEPEGFNGTYPTSSIGIDFSINGLDVPSDEPTVPDEPSDPDETLDGYAGFYMQNTCGGWEWFANADYIITIDDEGTYEISWSDVQGIINDDVGESLLYNESGDTSGNPSFGIQIGSNCIDEVGEKGRINAKVENIEIVLIDGTSFKIPARILKSNLCGKEEEWGFSGGSILCNFEAAIKATLDIDDDEYLEVLRNVDSITATINMEEFVPLSGAGDEVVSDDTLAPDAVEVTDVKVGKDYITFSWTQVENADGYNIYLKTEDGYSLVDSTTDNSYSYEAEPCTKYELEVRAYKDDDDAQVEGSGSGFTVKTFHNFDDSYTVDKEPTCSETGVKSFHCLNCDARTGAVEIPVTDHEYDSIEIAPTYTRKGYTLNYCYYCDHSYKSDYVDMLKLPVVKGLEVAESELLAVLLSWEENEHADGYYVEQYVGSQWEQIADVEDGALTTYKVTGLKPGAAYKFRIKAYALTKDGEAVTSSATASLTANTKMSAVKNFKSPSRSTTAIRLGWTKNAYADGYIIEQYDGSKWVQIADIDDGATVTYKVTGLKSGTAYKFRMSAYSVTKYGETIYGAKTTSLTANTQASAVTGLALKSRGSTALRLKWTKNTAVDGYAIEQYVDGAWKEIADIDSYATTEYKVTGLKPSTKYQFRMRAYAVTKYNEKTYSVYTATFAGNTSPSGMTGVSIINGGKSYLTLGWNCNSSAEGYRIEQYINGAWVEIADVTDKETVSYNVLNLESATEYKFRIRAYYMVGSTALFSSYVTTSAATL